MRLIPFIAILLALAPAITGTEFLFTGPGTVQKNITFTHQQIQGISFSFEGSPYSGDSPTNITFDIGGGNPEWEYKAYHSQEIQPASSVYAASSSLTENAEIYFYNITPQDTWAGMTVLAKIDNNAFTKYDDVSSGILGVQSSDDLTTQVVTLTLEDETVHAFLPNTSSITAVGLYVARGGSTYYCHSDHEDSWDNNCNMTPEQALVPEHLARTVNATRFNTTEHLNNNPKIIDAINQELQGCPLPCDVTITVTSQTAGNFTMADIEVTPPGNAPTINIDSNASHHQINITSDIDLTSVSYVYAEMPTIHVLPFQKEDEARNLTASQIARLAHLNRTLAEAWDNLTGSLHPLNFSFQLTPVPIEGLNGSADYSTFVDKRIHTLIPDLNLTGTAIVLTLDIWDYYGHEANTVKISGDDHIARIYINGFYNATDRGLYRWDEELQRNIILHELMHAFAEYPAPDAEKRFHSGHPSSFTDNPGFTTYTAAESPTGKEGYHSIHSIMNQLRIFIAEEDMGTAISLSALDRMLLGTLSPYAGGNYTFYSGNVTDAGDRYTPTAMTPGETMEAYDHYVRSSDEEWWDVRNLTRTWVGTDRSINITKVPGRALWVFADTAVHTDHFAVSGALSITGNATPLMTPPGDSAPWFTAVSPENDSYHDGAVTIDCSAMDDTLTNISIYGDWGGWHLNHTEATSGPEDTASITVTLPEGSYSYYCQACDAALCATTVDRSFTVDTTAPGVTPDAPANSSTWTTSTIPFRYNASGGSNCSLWVMERWAMNESSIVEGTNTFSYYLPNGDYNWSVTCRDRAGNSNATQLRYLTVSYTAPPAPPSSGGGGGGSGFAPSTNQEDSRKKSFYSIPAGTEIEWEIESFDVTGFSGTTKEASRNSEIIITRNDLCEGISCFTVNATGMTLEGATVRFRVNRTLIGEGKIAVRAGDGELLDAAELDADENYTYYEADITVPSSFIVERVELETAPDEKEENTETALKEEDAGPQTPPPTAPDEGTVTEEDRQDARTWILLAVPAAVMAAAAGIFAWRRFKQR